MSPTPKRERYKSIKFPMTHSQNNGKRLDNEVECEYTTLHHKRH